MSTAGLRPVLDRAPRLTVRGWFRVVFAVLAVLVLAAAAVIFQELASNRQVSAELQDSVLPAQAQAYRLQGALVDQETGVRGFALTGNPAFLQPYTRGLATQASAAARLRVLLSRRHQLAADLAGIERAAASWRRTYAVPLLALARPGAPASRGTALVDAGQRSFDHLRALFAAQNAHLRSAAVRDQASLSRSRDLINVTFPLIIGVLLLAAVALTVVLHNAVNRPLRRLRADSRRVMGGDYGHRIEPAGPTDLRAVAAAVEEMRGELVAALEGARAAQELAARQAADLDVQAAELLRSNAELEQFAYVASHDLQEPLRKVASFCQLLEQRYGDQLDDRARQYIAFAVDGAKRLQVLIGDLLTFSRVSRSGADQHLTPVPLDVPLDSALAAIAAAVEESGATIERPPRLPPVQGDASLLTMLWQNLLSNGIKFRTADRKPVVRITAAEAADGLWRFCVEDNGIGIPPEFAEKVFVIFQRLHPRDAYPGTGIGLALCMRIVEYHGGTIGLDSSFTGGARVCFTLPRINEGMRA